MGPLTPNVYPFAVTAAFSAHTSATEDDANQDQRLVRAIRSGNRAAEEQLYRAHGASVLHLATRLLRCSEDARDVLQDTFVIAITELDALRDPNMVRSWLHTICVRQVQRRFRKRRLLRALGLDRGTENAKLEHLAAPGLGPEARAELRVYDRALDTLPTAEKIAWTLRRVEGFSLEELANACKCSLATAKRRIATADALIERLREGRR